MYPKVINVKPDKNYILYLMFDNEEIRKFDLKPYLDFGIFAELKDVNVFNSVKVSFDTIEWSNQADLDPEFLYQKSELLQNSDVFTKDLQLV